MAKENNEPEVKPEVKPEKKTGTSADKVTESAEFERQINELTEKLTKVEKTRENEKILGDLSKELDLLKIKLPIIISSTGGKPWWKQILDELGTIFVD